MGWLMISWLTTVAGWAELDVMACLNLRHAQLVAVVEGIKVVEIVLAVTVVTSNTRSNLSSCIVLITVIEEIEGVKKKVVEIFVIVTVNVVAAVPVSPVTILGVASSPLTGFALDLSPRAIYRHPETFDAPTDQSCG